MKVMTIPQRRASPLEKMLKQMKSPSVNQENKEITTSLDLMEFTTNNPSSCLSKFVSSIPNSPVTSFFNQLQYNQLSSAALSEPFRKAVASGIYDDQVVQDILVSISFLISTMVYFVSLLFILTQRSLPSPTHSEYERNRAVVTTPFKTIPSAPAVNAVKMLNFNKLSSTMTKIDFLVSLGIDNDIMNDSFFIDVKNYILTNDITLMSDSLDVDGRFKYCVHANCPMLNCSKSLTSIVCATDGCPMVSCIDCVRCQNNSSLYEATGMTMKEITDENYVFYCPLCSGIVEK